MKREEQNVLLLSGMHSVEAEIRKSGFLKSDILLLARNQNEVRVRNLISKAEKSDCTIIKKKYSDLNQLCKSKNHQGIVLQRKEAIKLNEISRKDLLQLSQGHLFIALDSIEDPRNIGAIVRSMVAFEADGLIYSTRRSAPLGDTAMKTSAGTLTEIQLCSISSLANFLLEASKNNFFIIGADKGGRSLSSSYIKDKLIDNASIILVLGSEAKGLSNLVRERCDDFISISHGDKAESLNVSVSASILLHEFYRIKNELR